MKRFVVLITAFLLSLTVTAETTTPTTTSTSIDAPCCGPITDAGQKLLRTLDSSNVENLWLAHRHVNWETGEPDRDLSYQGHESATHCSAFAAAMGKKLGVYMLRPPEHGQRLLASAQTAWFASPAGIEQGWRAVSNAQEAQQLANKGELVVVGFQNPNPRKPGHIAIVRPSIKSLALLEQEGPQLTQAGSKNRSDWFARDAFRRHAGAWPNGVRYFAHEISNQQ